MSDSIFQGSRWGATRQFSAMQQRIKELEAILAATPQSGRRIALMMTWHGWQHEQVMKQWINIFWPAWGGGPVFEMRDLYVTEARNRITAGALNLDNWDDLLSLDADHFPNAYMVQRIREHDGKYPVLGGTYYGRQYPFDIQAWTTDAQVDGFLPIDPAILMRWLSSEIGVHRIDGCGTGTMVIRRDVLERMQRLRGAGNVWHTDRLPDALVRKISDEHRKRGKDGNFIVGATWSEDMQFCFDVASELGEPIHLDTSPYLHTGHETSMPVDFRFWQAAHFVPGSVTLDTDTLRKQGMEVRDLEAEYKRPQAREGKRLARQ